MSLTRRYTAPGRGCAKVEDVIRYDVAVVRATPPRTLFKTTMALLPPRLVIERDAQDRLVVRWENPPSPTTTLDAHELREIALALLDAASTLGGPSSGDENAH